MMYNSGAAEWRKLPVSLTDLCINTTLRCGQSFRWRKSGADEWSCALHGRLLTLKQDATHLHYRAIFPQSNSFLQAHKRHRHDLPTPPSSSPASSTSRLDDAVNDDSLKLIAHYLNLTPNLTALYTQWSQRDANFRRRVLADMKNLQGIRILKQDPWEALCGFICSSNNNIKRISLMMNRLCTHYGRFIAELEEEIEVLDDESDEENTPPTPSESGDSKSGIKRRFKKVKVAYHDFPPPSALTGPDTESTLRSLGFGYRARYIYETACMVANEKGGVEWLNGLVNPEIVTEHSSEEHVVLPPGGREGYRAAHEALLELTGVGPKVADCVCLMGLGWGESVPVDTHVWQIAVRDYKFGKGKGTMTKALYDAVGDKFRELWGKEAGWAHSVLFTADLRDFREKIVKVEIAEMVEDEAGVIVKKEDVDGEESVLETSLPKKRSGATRQGEYSVKTKVVVEKHVKRRADEDVRMTEEAQDMMSRVKRRRRRV